MDTYWRNNITNQVFILDPNSSLENYDGYTLMTDLQITQYNLQLKKPIRKQYITNKRIQLAEKSFIEYNGNNYYNSQNSRIAIISYVMSLTAQNTGTFFTYPNQTSIQLKKSDFLAIWSNIQTNEINLRLQEKDAFSKIDNAITIDEINAIDISL